ncbi:serine/threonine-protein kinase [Candidatus Oscillochloris fontis]|uniref:serine/threonine-protein kinase n=1 Tax=Candidatus Oscillochloris fontis TaxID=2496868 RepID=UPI00101D50BC|nr:serine/threonine-protein kinase [Candidatus Oscillochloris fontis]
MNCPNCNVQLPDDTAFCPNCGRRIGTSSQVLRTLQDRYELTKKLGQGGMGSVYLAADRRLSTVRWAVKEMSDAAITSPLERQQAGDAFRQEAELLARLSHPNLPRVTDHFEEDGKNYLVMEFVPGESLLDYCQRNPLPRPLNEVLGWVGQICDVLSYLHNQRPPVIFRDLKPANIILTPDGTLKLIDFGIARLFKPGQNRDTQAYGTMGYSAPEQYGRGQTDARSDIYSLGVLLHQLLTGFDPSAAPFRLPPASQVNPNIPAGISAALERATNNDPEQRFGSVEELRQSLLGSGQLVQRAVTSQPQIAASLGIPPTTTPAPPVGGMATSTDLARTAFWMGVVSAGMMLLAAILVGIGAASGDKDSGLASIGILFALLPMLTGPSSAIVGIVALTRPQTRNTSQGRRDAIVGITAGLSTLLLCCVVLVLMPSSDDDPETHLLQPVAHIISS